MMKASRCAGIPGHSTARIVALAIHEALDVTTTADARQNAREWIARYSTLEG